MDYIKGFYKKSIFDNGKGYYVGLFKVKESNIKSLNNKTVTFTGFFHELNEEDMYLFNGELIEHERYGEQFKVSDYKKVEPEGEDAIINFLSSPFIKGCGKETAKKLVLEYKDNTLNIIKNDIDAIKKVGIPDLKAEKIFKSLNDYYVFDDLIIKLKEYGLSVKEINKLINKYGVRIGTILKEDLYSLEEIEFEKLDRIYFSLYEETNEMRKKALIIETMKNICFENGDTYLYKEEILNYLITEFSIQIDEFDNLIDILSNEKKIKKIDNKYYLYTIYKDEKYIADTLYKISENEANKIKTIDDKEFILLEKRFNITYNDLQKDAIKKGIMNNVSIITGGPGTGKTTIVKGILTLYQIINNLSNEEMGKNVILLAPTGRAAKRLSEATSFPSSTIHRYLKWNKDTDTFGVDEYDPNLEKFIIIDEVSMMDVSLMTALLRGILHNVKLIMVGDEHQLPSIRCGNVLHDIIDSDMLPYTDLKYIYRQTDDSFIPVLANDIKNKELDESMLSKKDDYAFLQVDRPLIKDMIKKVVLKYLNQGITEDKLQVLVPMYRSENGIDNLNEILQNIYNPKNRKSDEIVVGPITYRVGDKVINLVNDIENNIYNGDIGYIVDIERSKNSINLVIDFDYNTVVIKKENFNQIRHAYAISIHKSQGSEFDYVIMPMSFEYTRMLYNKLIYTGVSRAKKSLVLVGEIEAFIKGVNNERMQIRKTSLTEYLMNKII